VPKISLVADITQVALAFMSPAYFNQEEASAFPLFTTVEIARSRFAHGTAIMIAIGGWGDTEGFEIAATSDGSRKLFASNIKNMVDITGADGTLFINFHSAGGLPSNVRQALILTGSTQGKQPGLHQSCIMKPCSD